MNKTKCLCGEPYPHYTNSEIEHQVNSIIERHGATIPITIENLGTFDVPRHFLALHGFSRKVVNDFNLHPINNEN